MSEIVVRVDLSQSARAAVTWAAAQARATGQTLQGVHAIGGSPARSRTLGIGGVAVLMEASEIDAVYREAVAAVFDSTQPDPAGNSGTSPAMRGLPWSPNPSGQHSWLWAQGTTSASAVLSPVR